MRLPILTKGVDPKNPEQITNLITFRDLEGLRLYFVPLPLREDAPPTIAPEGPLLMATNMMDNYGVEAYVIDLNGWRVPDDKSKHLSHQRGRHMTVDEAYNFILAWFATYGEPDVIAFSGLITTHRWQKPLAKKLRDQFPDVHIISGGGHATEFRNPTNGLLTMIPELSGIGHSEGDHVIKSILLDARVIKEAGGGNSGIARAYKAGKLSPYYLGEIHNRHRFVYDGNRPKDLDVLPTANIEILRRRPSDVQLERFLPNIHQHLKYDLAHMYLTQQVWSRGSNNSSASPFEVDINTTTVSTRGCPYECDYCYRGQQGERDWGMRSAFSMTHQYMTDYLKYGKGKRFMMSWLDDNAAVRLDRIELLSKMFLELAKLLGVEINIGTHYRMDENTKAMAKAFSSFLRYVGFGAESASDVVLTHMKKQQMMGKGLTSITVNGETIIVPLIMKEAIENCVEFNIYGSSTFILGHPGEHKKHLHQTLGFMLWIKDFYANSIRQWKDFNDQLFTCTYYPGTELVQWPKVRQRLYDAYGITFNVTTTSRPNKADQYHYEPVCNSALEDYLDDLGDAKLLLRGPKGAWLNYSEMEDEEVEKYRQLANKGELEQLFEATAT